MSETMTGTLTLLDAVKPGKVRHESDEDRDEVKAVPLVLWGPGGPAAVLAYRDAVLMSRREWVQELLPMLGGGQGAFPLTRRTRWSGAPPHKRFLDVLKPDAIATADVDGDGVDELVLNRMHGAVEVWSTRGRLHELRTPTSATDSVFYDGDPVAQVPLAGREEVFLHLTREVHGELDEARLRALGAADEDVIVRVGAGGLSRIVLKGLPPQKRKWLKLAPLNGPGSQEVDELVTLSSHGEGPGAVTWLSRFKLDGTPIGAPRELYDSSPMREPGAPDPVTERLMYPVVTPQSDRVLVVNRRGDRLYVFAPRKPVDWMRAVDLSFLLGGTVTALGMTRGARPLAILRHEQHPENVLYAVDEDAQFYERSGGEWVPSGPRMKPGTVREPGNVPRPFYRVKPAPADLEEGVTVLPAGGAEADEVVVVRSRKRTVRELKEDELLAAAKRFLPVDELARLEANATPNLDFGHPHLLRDEALQKERKERGDWDEIKSLEDWKKRLPRSYGEYEAFRRREFVRSLTVALASAVYWPGRPEFVDGYRERDAYLSWAKTLERPAATVFTHVRRGAEVASVEVPGYCFPAAAETELQQGYLSVRVRNGVLDAAVVLSQVPGEEEPRFYVVRAEPKGR